MSSFSTMVTLAKITVTLAHTDFKILLASKVYLDALKEASMMKCLGGDVEETNSTILSEKRSQSVFIFHLHIEKRDGVKMFISSTAVLHRLAVSWCGDYTRAFPSM